MPPKKKLSGKEGARYGAVEEENVPERLAAAKKKGKAAKAKASPDGKARFTVPDLVAKAEHFMDKMEPELALQFYKRCGGAGWLCGASSGTVPRSCVVRVCVTPQGTGPGTRQCVRYGCDGRSVFGTHG